MYRSNTVLRCIAHGIQSLLNTNKVVSKGIKQVLFVKETEIGINKSKRKPHFGILHNKAKDLILDIDLERRLRYPDYNAVTERRPGMVIYSNSLRKRTFKIAIGRK